MNTTVQITRARHAWPEKAGFTMDRPRGYPEFTFLHFFGSVSLLVEGRVQTLPPGACIFYDAGTPQWFHSPGPLQHDWMHLTGAVAEALRDAGLEPDRVYLPGERGFITELLAQIETEVLTQPEHHRLMGELKFRELLIRLSRSCAGGGGQNQSTAMQSRLRAVRSRVFLQLDRDWTVAEMASLAYLSTSRFHGLYRSVFGISPMEDLIRARIDQAKNRLLDTRQPIQDLAEQLGYRNVTHFCRQFKQLTGQTPSQFRQSRER